MSPYMPLGTGLKRSNVLLMTIYNNLGPEVAAVLPGCHAFTGYDNQIIVGFFLDKAK